METSGAVFLSLGGKFSLYFLFCWGEEEGKGVKWPCCLGREAREPCVQGRGEEEGSSTGCTAPGLSLPAPAAGRGGGDAGWCPCWPGRLHAGAARCLCFCAALWSFE